MDLETDYDWDEDEIPFYPRKFKVGDIVRKKSGQSPIKIKQVAGGRAQIKYIYGEYLHSERPVEDYEDKFLLMGEGEYTDPNPYQKDNTMENTMNNDSLYQILARTPETYAKYLATNSAGKLVMEVQGTGEIVTVAKTDIEEVVPYTVGIKFVSGNSTTTTYHYFSNKGDVDKGDLITIKDTGLAVVVSVDTKNKSATKHLEGKKAMMSPFGSIAPQSDGGAA